MESDGNIEIPLKLSSQESEIRIIRASQIVTAFKLIFLKPIE